MSVTKELIENYRVAAGDWVNLRELRKALKG